MEDPVVGVGRLDVVDEAGDVETLRGLEVGKEGVAVDGGHALVAVHRVEDTIGKVTGGVGGEVVGLDTRLHVADNLLAAELATETAVLEDGAHVVGGNRIYAILVVVERDVAVGHHYIIRWGLQAAHGTVGEHRGKEETGSLFRHVMGEGHAALAGGGIRHLLDLVVDATGHGSGICTPSASVNDMVLAGEKAGFSTLFLHTFGYLGAKIRIFPQMKKKKTLNNLSLLRK